MTNKRTAHGETPLMVAVNRDHGGCVQILLENGAEPDIQNNEKETPLYRGNTHSSGKHLAYLSLVTGNQRSSRTSSDLPDQSILEHGGGGMMMRGVQSIQSAGLRFVSRILWLPHINTAPPPCSRIL